MRALSLTATCLLPVVLLAQQTTVVSLLDTREQIDQFASKVRSCFVEPVDAPRSEGTGAMRIRFFGHPSLEADPQVAATARGGGLPYTDWRPYESMLLDLRGTPGEPFTVAVFVTSGDAEHVKRFELTADEWTTAQIAVGDLSEAGLDVSNIASVGVRVELDGRRRPARAILDNVRLTGTDTAAIQASRAREDARNALRPPPSPRRTAAVQTVARLAPTGQTIRRVVEAPVVATPEVVVVGGGLAGVAAAVTAARTGADVLLVERAGSLGGMATTGLVPPAINETLSEGIVREFCDRLERVGGPARMWNPEIMRHVLLLMMRESGAKLMLYSLAVDAITEGNRLKGIMVEGKSGPQAILATVTIDCTGDGDIAAKAGAAFDIGRGRDDETQTHTLVFLLGNVDTRRLIPMRTDIPEMVRDARKRGELRSPYAGGSAIQPVVVGDHGVVNVNMINIPQVSGLRIEDLTYSHIEAQQEALELAEFFRGHVPGCEECYLLSTAEFIGVRESRRIIGEYTLTGEEVLEGATFDDGIARGFYPVDIHAADTTGDAAGARLSKFYDIPYRCLVPRDMEGLLVAGRCISADHVAHGSLRVMGTTMPLGEAAGCAAALCVAENVDPRQVPGEKVRALLESLGGLPDMGIQIPLNLASAQAGTTASADSVYDKSGYVPQNAIDGLVAKDMMSRWLSADVPGPHWIQLEFRQPETFNRVRLHFFAHPRMADATQYVPRGFAIQVPQGDDWRTVAQASDNTELEPLARFESVTAQRLRVLFTVACPSDDIIRLREIVVR